MLFFRIRQDVRQRHHPGEQSRKDECYGVDFTDGFDEEQYNIQSFSLDQAFANSEYFLIFSENP
tara:strand:- start:212 stop:403 length:192 start_codon:yes stop_codon:yes gene_type:complete